MLSWLGKRAVDMKREGMTITAIAKKPGADVEVVRGWLEARSKGR